MLRLGRFGVVVGSFLAATAAAGFAVRWTIQRRLLLAASAARRKTFGVLFSPTLCSLCDAFATQGFSVRVVGGACRDLLLGQTPTGLDLVTDCPPGVLRQVCEWSSFSCKLVQSGTDGSTGTTMVVWVHPEDPAEPISKFELTVLREFDRCSRIAQRKSRKELSVERWVADASQRDFTMNAIFVAPNGETIDSFGGEEDIAQRRVVWIGSVAERMAESPERALRYFRFHGEFVRLFGRAAAEHDGLVLAEMGAHAGLLRAVPAGVAWKLLKQTVCSCAHAVAKEIAVMAAHGLLGPLLPSSVAVSACDFAAADAVRLQQEAASELGVPIEPVLSIVVLLRCDAAAVAAVSRHWCSLLAVLCPPCIGWV